MAFEWGEGIALKHTFAFDGNAIEWIDPHIDPLCMRNHSGLARYVRAAIPDAHAFFARDHEPALHDGSYVPCGGAVVTERWSYLSACRKNNQFKWTKSQT